MLDNDFAIFYSTNTIVTKHNCPHQSDILTTTRYYTRQIGQVT